MPSFNLVEFGRFWIGNRKRPRAFSPRGSETESGRNRPAKSIPAKSGRHNGRRTIGERGGGQARPTCFIYSIIPRTGNNPCCLAARFSSTCSAARFCDQCWRSRREEAKTTKEKRVARFTKRNPTTTNFNYWEGLESFHKLKKLETVF